MKRSSGRWLTVALGACIGSLLTLWLTGALPWQHHRSRPAPRIIVNGTATRLQDGFDVTGTVTEMNFLVLVLREDPSGQELQFPLEPLAPYAKNPDAFYRALKSAQHRGTELEISYREGHVRARDTGRRPPKQR